jgi:DNA repair protein RecN (Recombination protein N)
MLKHLSLKNLVLVDACALDFEQGFTVLSGETGSGKTALIEAVGLCLGKRADLSSIRTGADKAVVEAAFDLDGAPHLISKLVEVLKEGGIEYDSSELLVIRREMSKEGKSRAFINCQLASLPLIQKIGCFLVDLIGQHSHQQLKEPPFHRSLIDLYGELETELSAFQAAFEEAKTALHAYETLSEKGLQREKELAFASEQLKELEEAKIQEGEEERISEEYGRLSHFKELTEKGELIAMSLSKSPQSILSQLSRARSLSASLSQIDPSLKTLVELFQEASISLDEASRKITSYLAGLDLDPKRLSYLEERLAIIHKIERKYGTDISSYKKQLQETLFHLENFDEQLEEAKQLSEKKQQEAEKRADILSEKRQKASHKLEKALSLSLQTLNMPGSEVKIELSPAPLSTYGKDAIRFLLKANIGERFLPVEESSSGGELSRLLLAIKLTLAEKNNTLTLIFDEIDANVGGETASCIGEKLRALGSVRQVLCVTHFPQVARRADHHFSVQKHEHGGRTTTLISPLDSLEKEKELLRMLGGPLQAT